MSPTYWFVHFVSAVTSIKYKILAFFCDISGHSYLNFLVRKYKILVLVRRNTVAVSAVSNVHTCYWCAVFLTPERILSFRFKGEWMFGFLF
jgi:hypothetical protein